MSESTYSTPPRVRSGDTVAVCAPASPVRADRLRAGVAVLEQRFRVVMPSGTLSRTGFLAGDDDRRADELNALLRDPDVRAIVVARGGYGIMRILDRLDDAALRSDPKLIVGFSDVTALLSWALLRGKLSSIHGPVAAQLGELGGEDQQWLLDMMEGVVKPGPVATGLSPIGCAASDIVSGPLLGGNLCLLSHLLGTPYQVPFGGAIAFFEEVGERPYAIDRYLTSLSLSKAFEGVQAVVVGDLVRCEENTEDDHPGPYEVVDERLTSFGLAGVREMPFGHGDRNLALPFGGKAELDFDAGELRLLQGAVD